MLEKAIAFLLDSRNPDGGWGGRTGVPSDTETTSLAVLALRGGLMGTAVEGLAEAHDGGVAWLLTRQRGDGSWPARESVDRGSWMTALAALALGGLDEERPSAVAGARWLLEREGLTTPWLTRLLRILVPADRRRKAAVELDPDLAGWPWTEETFSWVEPTAYALLALKSLSASLEGAAAERIREGEAMILDRMCEGGGWNYGNSRVLGEELWPYPDTTAVALLALQDLPRSPAIDRSLAALRRLMDEHDSGLSLSLAILCLRVYGAPPSEVDRLGGRLEAAFERTGFLDDGRVFALAALALTDGASLLTVPTS